MRCVKPSKVKGTVRAPSSKSMTGRAVAAALLGDGVSLLENVSSCDDGRVAVALAKALGSEVGNEKGMVSIRGTAGILKPRTAALDCGESGLSMRMFAPIASLLPSPVTLTASGSLRARPMAMVEQLSALGVSCTTDQGYPPVRVKGPLRGRELRLDASVSSQLLTGLLMALPLCDRDSIIHAENLKSTPYVRMTMELLKRFGVETAFDEKAMELFVRGKQRYRSCHYTVEGDWSGAAFLLVAGATAGSVQVTGLDLASAQADRAVLEVLQQAGARVEVTKESVLVERAELSPFEFDATHCPDLFPPLVALAASCPGKSLIHGLDRLIHKESDRAQALALEFTRLGITISGEGNSMGITGGRIQGGSVDSHGDHRIAMACAVAALSADVPVTIHGDGCVSKSYPAFFSDLETIEVT